MSLIDLMLLNLVYDAQHTPQQKMNSLSYIIQPSHGKVNDALEKNLEIPSKQEQQLVSSYRHVGMSFTSCNLNESRHYAKCLNTRQREFMLTQALVC